MWSISAAHNKYLNDPRFCLFFAFILIVTVSVNGQGTIPVLHQNVNLPAEDLRLDYLLRLINKQTGVKFSLNTQKFKPSRIIHLRKGIQSIDVILSEIKNSTGVYFTYLGDHVIFIDKPPANSTVTAPSLSPISPASSVSPPSPPPPPSSSVPHFAALPHTEKYLPEERIDNDKIYQAMAPPVNHIDNPLLIRTDQSVRNPPPSPSTSFQTRPNKQSTSVPTRFFADAGLTADETMYINPSIRVGLPFLYGIVQGSTNFSVSGLRYGAGGSFRLADKWRLGLVATTGDYSKDYPALSVGSPTVPITVKTSLQKIGLSAEAAIGRNIQIQFGPVLNRLVTKYSTYGIPIPLIVNETEANKYFHYIKPVNTIQDTYSPYSPQNTKLWIGLQAGLFYRINFLKSR